MHEYRTATHNFPIESCHNESSNYSRLSLTARQCPMHSQRSIVYRNPQRLIPICQPCRFNAMRTCQPAAAHTVVKHNTKLAHHSPFGHHQPKGDAKSKSSHETFKLFKVAEIGNHVPGSKENGLHIQAGSNRQLTQQTLKPSTCSGFSNKRQCAAKAFLTNLLTQWWGLTSRPSTASRYVHPCVRCRGKK